MGVFGPGSGGLGDVNVRVAGVHAIANGLGIHIEGTNIIVDGNVVRDNPFEGILVANQSEGAEVIVRNNRADGNFSGIEVYLAGEAGLRLSGNVVTGNVVGFVLADGIAGSVAFNRATVNRGMGFYISGENIHVVGNVSTRNGGGTDAEIFSRDGFMSDCRSCRFSQNRSSYNRGWGIFDGNPDTNLYTDNRCTGNALGSSDPSALCE